MINSLFSLKKFFAQIQDRFSIFGVGVQAFNRLGPEDFLSQYRLLSLRYSLDAALIEKNIPLFSLERDHPTKHLRQPRNSTTVLRHTKTQKYLSRFKNVVILPYKASRRMEKICQGQGWILAANPAHFGKKLFENKVKFRRILEKLGVPVPPGKIVKYGALKGKFLYFRQKYGLPFIIQHPTKGGGRGNFLISNQEKFNHALKRIAEYDKDVSRLNLLVVQFVQGLSPSITGCVTRQGILSTNLQLQILDVPECCNLKTKEGFGRFCGHDWSFKLEIDIQQQAYEIIQKVGQYFQELGYRGIFGLDFVLDKDQRKLYVVEANPRLLGSFPTLTMVQLKNQEPPIIAFHLLEFLEVDYEIDINWINQLMRQEKQGSQLLAHNQEGRRTRNQKELQPGVYRIKKESLEYLRPGYALKHLQAKDEFVITDGVPFAGSVFDTDQRLFRILTLTSVLRDCYTLNPWASQIASLSYDALGLKGV